MRIHSPLAVFIPGLMLVFTSSASLASSFVGTWNNTSFLSTGALSLDNTIVGTTVMSTLDVDGFVFGITDPPPIDIPGTLNPDGSIDWSLSGDPLFGDISASLSASGILTMDTLPPPSTGVASMEVDGMFDSAGQHAEGTYLIVFVGGLRPEDGGIERDDFALGTIELDAVAAIPVPAAVWLFGSGLLGLFGVAKRCRGRRHF